jgi:cytoskeletal protein RodZ
VTEGVQLDAFITPGSLLKKARMAKGMSEREAADRLNLMPNYVAILERDDYQALRSPPFARGYVKAYGRLLGLMSVFDALNVAEPARQEKRMDTRPLQLQRTGLGVVIGLGILLVLVVALWWWEREWDGQSLPLLDEGRQRLLDGTPLTTGGEG